jgi:hypothetical protein
MAAGTQPEQNQSSVGLFQKEKMTDVQFTNIINFACFVGDFDWARLFMEQHSHLLNREHYDNAILLSNGLLLSAQKKSRATLDLLEQTNFNDVHLSMRARSLILKSFYELQEPAERILSNCSAFNAFLSRNRKSHSSSIESTQNFVKIVKMMVNGKKDKADITHIINATKPLFLKKMAAGNERKVIYD